MYTKLRHGESQNLLYWNSLQVYVQLLIVLLLKVVRNWID